MIKVDRIKHMLLSEYDRFTNRIDKCSSVYVQPKLNGFRAMGDRSDNCLYSRNLIDFELSHIESDLEDMPVNLIPDGELYCHGHSLSKIQSMIRRGDERIQFHVFDHVSDEAFSSRSRELMESIRETTSIKIVPTFRISPSEIMTYHDMFLDQGYEGIVIRLEGYAYEQYRSEHIFKKKPREVNSLAAMFI